MHQNGSTPISVKEARKRLGVMYSDLSDEAIEDLVNLIGSIVRETITDLSSKNRIK